LRNVGSFVRILASDFLSNSNEKQSASHLVGEHISKSRTVLYINAISTRVEGMKVPDGQTGGGRARKAHGFQHGVVMLSNIENPSSCDEKLL
jgi:hypothetical protein